MTTSITVRVNGRYTAVVTQDLSPAVIVEGNYDGRSGEHVFILPHGTESNFRISEREAPAPVAVAEGGPAKAPTPSAASVPIKK